MITSSAQFQVVIGLAVTHAIEEVVHKAHNELVKIIEQTISSGTSYYKPADIGLSGAWRVEVRNLFGSIVYDPNLMSLMASAWQHGSAYDNSWRDVRDILIDILEGGYRAFNANTGREVAPRKFWDKFMRRLDKNFEKWMRAALRRQGLKVIA